MTDESNGAGSSRRSCILAAVADPSSASSTVAINHHAGTSGSSSPWRHAGRARIAGVFVAFGAFDALVTGTHIAHGGLYTDDWPFASIQHQQGTWGLFDNLVSANHGRPLAALYQALTAALSGTNPHLHALWGLVTLLLATTTIYATLRRLSVSIFMSSAIALLFMAFPFSDSAWLWYAASHSYLAITLAALGYLVAIVDLQGTRQRHGTARIAVAFLFAASILTYQVASGAICLSILVYIVYTRSRGEAIVLWLSDVVVVLLTLTLPRLITGSGGSTADPIISLSAQVSHLRLMANQGATLLSKVLFPFGSLDRRLVLSVAVISLIGCVLVCWRRANDRSAAMCSLRWLWLGLAGSVVVAGSYIVYVPAPINLYQPLGMGEENRVNVLAGLGFAIIVCAFAVGVGNAVLMLLRRSRQWVPVIATVLMAPILTGYIRRTRADVAAWDRAGEVQRSELFALRRLGAPASGTTLYVFGGVGAIAPGVFAFRVTWDLNSAVELLWNDATLHAYPIFAGTQMTCLTARVVPVGPSNGDGIGQAASYGHAVFVNLRTGQSMHVADMPACERAATRFVPGPAERWLSEGDRR